MKKIREDKLSQFQDMRQRASQRVVFSVKSCNGNMSQPIVGQMGAIKTFGDL